MSGDEFAGPPPGVAGPAQPCPTCPICQGKMEMVYTRYNQQVCACHDCHAAVTVPSSTYEVLRLKREGKWQPAPETP